MSTQETKLTAIADAIRAKEGSTAPIPANDFASRILALETGGLPDDVYTIDVQASDPEGGTVSGGGVAASGMTVTVSATPADTHEFDGWTENGTAVSADEQYTFQVSADRNLIAGFAEKSASRLPEGYTEVKYIESNSTQYINTNVKPSVTTKIYMDVEPLATNTSNTAQHFFNSSFLKTRPLYAFRMVWGKNGISAVMGASENISPKTVSSNTAARRMNLELNAVEKMAVVDSESVAMSDNSVSASMDSFTLLTFNGSSEYSLSAKLYSCQIYDGGTLARDFVPCINPENEVGLYDLVGNVFYPSSSSTAFTAGPAI